MRISKPSAAIDSSSNSLTFDITTEMSVGFPPPVRRRISSAIIERHNTRETKSSLTPSEEPFETYSKKAPAYFESDLEIPEEVELAVRTKDGVDYIFLLNYKPYAVTIVIKEPMDELLSGRKIFGTSELERFGVMVLIGK